MDCPICTLPMQVRHDRGVELDVCANDHTFFDADELANTDPLGAELEARLFSRVEGVPANSRKCPRCRGSLRHTDHDGRQAEVCVACGGIVLWTVKWTEDELVGVAAAFTAVPQPTGRPVADGIAMGLDGAADLAEVAVDLAVDGPDLLDAAGGAVDLAGGAVELAGGAAELALHAVGGVFSFLGALLE